MLWGYEPSPFTRVDRERIVELEIPHLFKTTCRGSVKRQEMFDKYGKFQAPLLEVRPSPAHPLRKARAQTSMHDMCCAAPHVSRALQWSL